MDRASCKTQSPSLDSLSIVLLVRSSVCPCVRLLHLNGGVCWLFLLLEICQCV